MSEKPGYFMEDDLDGRGDLEAGEDEGDNVRRATWWSLFNFTSGIHILPLAMAIIFSIASGIIIPALAVFLGKIFDLFTRFGADEISGPDLVYQVSTYGIALSGLGCASGILNATYYGIWLTFGELQAKSAREKLFDGMLGKDMGWYDMRKAGIDTMISRQQSHIRDLQMATSQPLGFATQYAVTTVAALGLAFYYSWSLTLVTLATVPLSAVFLAWLSASMQPGVKAQIEALTIASKFATNAISAIDTVKCFNGQNHELWQYVAAVRKAAKFYLVQARANALQIGFVRLVTLGMFVQGFWYGSYLVNTGKKNPGDILTAFWAALMATQSIEQILPQMIVLEKGRAAGATLRAMLVQIKGGRTVLQMVGGNKPLYCDGDVEIRNVTFSYPSRQRQMALDHVDFFFPAGETTFVVGRSGSGKSTLGNLIMRFYTPASGELLIDGNSIQTLDLGWLRNNITLVQQQSVLFNETILKNITFGRRNHSTVRKDEVKRSIKMALLQHTISELPHGLDTAVGVGGSALSGGQKQRVALARARLRNTPILILDEATSALDHLTKTLVVEAIREWRQGKTTIIITHDMSQVHEHDYAYVLENGRIVQEGLKHALEKTLTGPFVPSAISTVRFPTSPRSTSSFIGRRRSDAKKGPISPLRMVSDDQTDIEISRKRKFIPSVFGSLPEGSYSRRASQGLLSPGASAAITMKWPSGASSSYHRSRRKSVEPVTIAELIELANLKLPETQKVLDDQDLFEETERNNVIYTENQRSTQERGQKRRMPTASTVEVPPLRKRSLTQAEKVRRIAPIKRILWTIWPSLPWPKRLILILGFVCAALHAAATPLFSYVFSELLATFFLPDRGVRSQKALVWSLSVLGVAVVDATASYLMHILLEYCGQAWVDSLRTEALKRILDQPRAWFEGQQNSVNRLTDCLDRNAEEMRNLLGRFAGFIFVAVIMMAIALIWSLILCSKLTLVGLGSAPFMYAVTRYFEYTSGIWETRSNEAASAANGTFTETFSNIRTVRALTLEGYFHRKYLKATSATLHIGLKRSACSGFFFGLSDSAIIFVTALIFWYGAHLASTAAYPTRNILTVFTMLLFSIANANAIVAFIPQISSSRATATSLLRLAHLPYGTSHEHGGRIRLSSPGPITFSSTSFSYPTRPTFRVLSSLSLTLPTGHSTALVGASGCGKSTIASLLLGLYPATSGSITISSIPLSALHLPTLRHLIALVPQAPYLFPTTIASNIAYPLLASTPQASITAAARLAGIHDFITSLPLGYATPIGPGGTTLSGGQQQRIALARAIVRKPKLLIMDEPTSGLDSQTAGYVTRLVRRCKAVGIGVLVISHERALMECCDDVVVIGDGGAVVERGGFEDLISGKVGRGELRRLLGEGEVDGKRMIR